MKKTRSNGQGTVFQLRNGNWRAAITKWDGTRRKRVSVTCKTREAAEQSLRKLLSHNRLSKPHPLTWKTHFPSELFQVKHPCVYFVEAAGLGKIKIGYASHAATRLLNLQTACPVLLTVLAIIPGTPDDELEIQKQFRHLRCHGEWYFATDELRAYISARGYFAATSAPSTT